MNMNNCNMNNCGMNSCGRNNGSMSRNASCAGEARNTGAAAGMSPRASCGMVQPGSGMQPGLETQPCPEMQPGPGMQPGSGIQPGLETQPGQAVQFRQGMQPNGNRMYTGNAQMNQPQAGNREMLQNRCSLMRQINEASFAMDDAQLFLDTHPDSAPALQYYRNAAAMRRNAMDAYQRQFGPLMVDEASGKDWNWVTEFWPWEGGI